MSAPALKSYFTDDWYKFTDDEVDESKVSAILSGLTSPDNKPHISTAEGLVEASRQFMELNGEACARAEERLLSRKAH